MRVSHFSKEERLFRTHLVIVKKVIDIVLDPKFTDWPELRIELVEEGAELLKQAVVELSRDHADTLKGGGE